jgi:hypothetical protein
MISLIRTKEQDRLYRLEQHIKDYIFELDNPVPCHVMKKTIIERIKNNLSES